MAFEFLKRPRGPAAVAETFPERAPDPFFDRFFPPDFWSSMDRSRFVTSEHSMFGDQPFFDWIIETVRPGTVIELGSWKGHSANYMADRCKALGLGTRIVCVDTFLGGPEHWVLPDLYEELGRTNGRPTILEAFCGNTLARGNERHVFPLPVDTNSASHIMRDLGFKADLVFVDAGHTYEQATHDIEGFWPLLSERGVMFGDDYQGEPVADAVHAFARKVGCQVGVSLRKWVLVTESLMRYLGPADIQIRQGWAGWVHP